MGNDMTCCVFTPPSQALRGYENHDVQMSLTVVYCLLLSTPDFMKRVNALVKEVCVPRVSPPSLASLLQALGALGRGG